MIRTLTGTILLLITAGPALADVGVIPLGARFDLTPAGLDLDARFGTDVVMSQDGRTALVGMPGLSGAPDEVLVYVRTADGWSVQARLDAPATALGRALALSAAADLALAGAESADSCPDCGGAVYVFRRSGPAWTLEAELIGSQSNFLSFFGSQVALSADGTTALVGAPLEFCGGPSCGAAYVFRQSGGIWTEVARLAVPTSPLEAFGASVALSADGARLFVAGSGAECSGGGDCGKAYVFEENAGTWSQQGEIAPADRQPTSLWGAGLAVDAAGRLALLGAPGAECPASLNCGEAALFEEIGGTWIERARFAGPSGNDSGFGSAVALTPDGRAALIGAPGEPCGASGCGAAYLFRGVGGDGWALTTRLTATAPAAGSRFGSALSLAADAHTAVVGEPWKPCEIGPAHQPCGAAYAFEDIALTAVPTAGAAALVLLALSLAAAGTFVLRRL